MNWPVLIGAIVGGGGIFGGIVALIKVRPEAGQVVVMAAEGAVVIQERVLTRLDGDIDRLTKENAECRRQLAELKETVLECAQIHAQNERLDMENQALAKRFRQLEDKVARMHGEKSPNRDRRTKPRERSEE